jgi:putative transposase
MFTEQSNCDVVELNVQFDHVHLIAMIPPKLSISDFVGKVKERSAIRILGMFSELRLKKYWGNHQWAPGYCVAQLGLPPR